MHNLQPLKNRPKSNDGKREFTNDSDVSIGMVAADRLLLLLLLLLMLLQCDDADDETEERHRSVSDVPVTCVKQSVVAMVTHDDDDGDSITREIKLNHAHIFAPNP